MRFQPHRLGARVVVADILQMRSRDSDEIGDGQPPITKATAGPLQVTPEELRAIVIEVRVEAARQVVCVYVSQLVDGSRFQVHHPEIVVDAAPRSSGLASKDPPVLGFLCLKDEIATARMRFWLALALVR